MKFNIYNKYFRDENDVEIEFLLIEGNGCRINWFTDCGDWFFYIILGKRFWRFSSAGYMDYRCKR